MSSPLVLTGDLLRQRHLYLNAAFLSTMPRLFGHVSASRNTFEVVVELSIDIFFDRAMELLVISVESLIRERIPSAST
ncbi:hypothetical protein [Rubinisphaera sp.]|uniref:hypothetical protein n=1 Tax=Rubinisphaera sp. TaxID=2024857 RepID=UPI0025E480C5|nr:hypothetical protein [Rubinisphaera sp.]